MAPLLGPSGNLGGGTVNAHDGESSPALSRNHSLAPTSHTGLLGVNVSVGTVDDLLAYVEKAVATSSLVVVAAHNLHSVYVSRTNPTFADFYDRCDVVVVDGWPILAALNRERAAQGNPALSSEYRFGSTDWIEQAAALSSVRRVGVIGAQPASSEAFAKRLRSGPGAPEVLAIPGHPWTSEGAGGVYDQLRAFEPDLVLVGMGMPLQESVITSLIDHLDHAVIAAVGGAIDQLSGAQALAPRWTGRLRIEWLWRLAADPRRLAGRYLVEPMSLARVVIKERRAR